MPRSCSFWEESPLTGSWDKRDPCLLGCSSLARGPCLTEMGEEKERVVLVHISYQIFVDFLEQMFLHLLFALGTISREFDSLKNNF